MNHSIAWIRHFRSNLCPRKPIDWSVRPMLDSRQHRPLLRSLQAWQLGETSDGSHLLRAATAYTRKVGDPDYREAIQLFIAEEQKHGENLGKYLDRVGVPRLKFDLGDWIFRRVRYLLASIEIWTTAVILVESVGELYYATLGRFAGCPLLAQICNEILYDEAYHIRFQCERLALIVQGRPPGLRLFTQGAQVALCGCVIGSVWALHRHVFALRGWDFGEFSRRVWGKLQRAWQLMERFEVQLRRQLPCRLVPEVVTVPGTHDAAGGGRW